MAKFNEKSLSQISMQKILNTVERVDNQFRMVGKRGRSKKLHDIVFSYQPIYYLSRFFGLLPFSFTYDSNGEVQAPKVHVIDGLWFVVSIIVYLVMANAASMGIEIRKNTLAPILVLGNHLLLIFGLIYGAIMIVENMCKRFQFVKILRVFAAFDNEVSW